MFTQSKSKFDFQNEDDFFHLPAPPVNVGLDVPLRVRRNTGLYRLLEMTHQLMEGGVTTLGRILQIVKSIIVHYNLYDVRCVFEVFD